MLQVVRCAAVVAGMHIYRLPIHQAPLAFCVMLNTMPEAFETLVAP